MSLLAMASNLAPTYYIATTSNIRALALLSTTKSQSHVQIENARPLLFFVLKSSHVQGQGLNEVQLSASVSMQETQSQKRDR